MSIDRCEYHPDRAAVAWRRLQILGGAARGYCADCARALIAMGARFDNQPSSAEEARAQRPIDGGNDE